MLLARFSRTLYTPTHEYVVPRSMPITVPSFSCAVEGGQKAGGVGAWRAGWCRRLGEQPQAGAAWRRDKVTLFWKEAVL